MLAVRNSERDGKLFLVVTNGKIDAGSTIYQVVDCVRIFRSVQELTIVKYQALSSQFGNWCQQFHNRKEYTCMQYMATWFQCITDSVMSERLFSSVDACQSLVVEALKYHLLPDRRQTMCSIRTQPRKSYVGHIFAFGTSDSGMAPRSTMNILQPFFIQASWRLWQCWLPIGRSNKLEIG